MTSLKVKTGPDEMEYFHSDEDNISVFDSDRHNLGVRVMIGAVRVATFYNCRWYRFYEPHWKTEEGPPAPDGTITCEEAGLSEELTKLYRS
ncbi:unnamed protein product [marine sediment metagenome]|uniref:Uncharacterized protein n=1 Tax=marine sediment metagenome TaxID=412755 RepID=X0SAT9_9ZZZZ